ncbi:YbaB/EbfC family nucleoid-associated protein [Glycomyces sp. A-F 0318]|uniref:YbaB/EbfC family nucleoid-associated protein n=1 Tax=Glycomyces amatae TaxID=2881355 RepID=UPI001E3A82EB|nr:YbaB/EbfC family nucleoid-associated protein [Glycomyces amatae]MCD0445491.1 YbaB/EbfC family nucleoid-associated protein [Glycomyces amatae]
MTRIEQGLSELASSIGRFKGVRESLAQAMRAQATSPDGTVTVTADAERASTIRIDADGAAALDPGEVESAVLQTYNRAQRQLREQMLRALPPNLDHPSG